EEHWADDAFVSAARNKAERDRRIASYRESQDSQQRARIARYDRAKRTADAIDLFVRGSERFELTAVGDINTYALFAELSRNLINPVGQAGVIVPTGVATDDTYKRFFADLTSKGNIVSFFD